MSLELTGVHGLLKRHKLFTHKFVTFPLLNNFLLSKNICYYSQSV